MTTHRDDIALTDAPNDALAARLDAQMAAFTFDATNIRDVTASRHDDDGELIGGVQVPWAMRTGSCARGAAPCPLR